MKVLIGTESLRPPLTGIGNYTLNLIRELQLRSDVEAIDCFNGDRFSTAEHVLVTANQLIEPVTESRHQGGVKAQLRKTLRGLPLAYRLKSAWSNARFKRGGEVRSGFVYHEPNFILKPHDGPCVTTVHDLSFVRHPEFHPPERVRWLSRQLPRTLERADYVIADSEVVRSELIQQFGVRPDRVRAIYLGADARFIPRSPEECKAVLARYGLVHGGYLAFVGTIEPRKGLSVLLDAWERLPVTMRKSWPLVIAGAPGWRNSELVKRIQTLQAKGEVRFLQFVNAYELPFIYAGAAAFIYPSVYEGFGLPVLESMASGVPVICGEGTSMAEFAQGACKLFDVDDCDALALSIVELLESPQQRLQMANVALVQANSFSWARCAQETLQVYAEAEKNHSQGSYDETR